ncbi:DUF4957 domain-containing protein [Pedobacter sp. ASV28]|uniref:DUF4957 domain-containing protein n=1 Tax=Pedobacter sp. ASV28 TaxID=2795123 RepID=UPI0018EBE656|nr:DUF4957 domain-containing protein [Pedobacter sp. ASV28]
MKTNIILNKGWQLLLLVALTALVYACKKNDPNEGLEEPRLFKPSRISIKTTQSSAKITWTAPLLTSNLKLSYATEFSQDSTFATSEFSLQTDTAGVTVDDDKLKVRKKYYVRIKTLSTNNQPESNWLVSSSFSISGEQLFLPIRELEIKETQVTLRWKPTTGLNKITLTRDGGNTMDYTISGTEGTTGVKLITGLDAGVKYTAEIYEGVKSKGILTFNTLSPTVYAVTLNPGDDIVAAVNAAANDAIIGLNPGTYSAGTSVFTLLQKSVTLKSTSGNPLDTKINFREFTLRGTGAGIKLDGVELDGTPSGSLYFINLTGVLADAELASFAPVVINNSIVHGATTSFLRANRGAAAGSYKMDYITVNNSIVYDIGSTLGYTFFHLDKLQFNALNITKSTFYNIGRALLTCSTVIPSTPPVVTVDYCTFNYFGASTNYVFMDANANPVRFNMTNSIIANVPRVGATVNAVTIRATGTGSGVVFNNNNTFNFVNTNGGSALTFPATITTQANNQTVNLNWVSTTDNFTLPATSPLRTASTAGAPIGDPRWTY